MKEEEPQISAKEKVNAIIKMNTWNLDEYGEDAPESSQSFLHSEDSEIEQEFKEAVENELEQQAALERERKFQDAKSHMVRAQNPVNRLNLKESTIPLSALYN